jgi:hypothetical protein
MPDDASWLSGLVVPDDLSELSADIEAYHREVRQAARRQRFARITGTRAWQRLALPAVVVVGSLAVAGSVFAILTFGHPRPVVGPQAAPIATNVLPKPGQIGGLLPDVVLRTPQGALNVRNLRPALVALVPLRCDCKTLLDTLAGQAAEVALPLVVVAPAGQDAEVDALAGQIHAGSVVPTFDVHGRLSQVYGGTGVTVLGLRPDATVSFVNTGVDASLRLEPWLQQMLRPTESLSST